MVYFHNTACAIFENTLPLPYRIVSYTVDIYLNNENQSFSAKPHIGAAKNGIDPAEGCLKVRKGEVTVFFRNYSTYEGEPGRLYRSPERIREDILDIKTKITTVNSRLNVREVLTTMIDECAKGEPEVWIPALAAIVSDAEETLDRLKSLRESLDVLAEELEDTKWALGI